MSEHTLERGRMAPTLAPSSAPSLAWSRSAICETADPDLFFPQPGTDTTYARSMCKACPVRRQCLDYALETKQKFGIWGGMTESQRRRLRREDATANHPARPAHLRPTGTASPDAGITEPDPTPVGIARPRLYLVR
ncbi:MAG: WhiB family regulatory protein [Ilumatobacteraceae bacterium]|nr:WhiB family regulatory protein [Ilumatobacteraceae bacterium]